MWNKPLAAIVQDVASLHGFRRCETHDRVSGSPIRSWVRRSSTRPSISNMVFSYCHQRIFLLADERLGNGVIKMKRTDMKPQIIFQHLALFCGVALLSHGACAQGSTTTTQRDDHVQSDLHSPADKHTTSPFHRTASLGPDRKYAVDITYADGSPRMKGSYLDPALNIPDGEFTYYYANGQVESTGAYDHGYKAGTWKCFTAAGQARADRIYYGMDWDHMQFLVGLSELAPTLGAATESNTPFGAPSTN